MIVNCLFCVINMNIPKIFIYRDLCIKMNDVKKKRITMNNNNWFCLFVFIVNTKFEY